MTNQLPYYAVIFTSKHNEPDETYSRMADRMEELASTQPGYIGIESSRNAEGFGITVSYWRSLEDIRSWKRNIEHQEAQRRGKEKWYSEYTVRVCEVKYEYDFHAIA